LKVEVTYLKLHFDIFNYPNSDSNIIPEIVFPYTSIAF
jgi:hypothetical protein